MWGYLCRILETYRKQYPQAYTLPVIVPLIFYTGKAIYPFSTDILTLFEEQRELASELLFGPYRLIELNKIPDETIQQHELSGLMEMILKHAGYRDAINLFNDLLESFINPLLQKHSDIEEHVVSMLNYAYNVSKDSERDVYIQTKVSNKQEREKLMEDIARKKPEKRIVADILKDWGMTTEEFARQTVDHIKWQLRMKQDAQQQGIEQGVHQGESNLIMKQLQYRFGNIPEIYIEKIKNANEETLFALSLKILDAKSLEEVFS